MSYVSFSSHLKGRTNLRTDGARRRHEDNTRFDVYALYGKKRWSFATSLGLGLHDHELERALGSMDVTVGLRYNRALRAIGHAPAGVFTVQSGVTASIGDVKSGVDMSIGGYGYRQESATRNRWGWNLGAGVDVPVRSNVSVYGAADAVMRGDSTSVDGQIGVKVSF